MITRMYRTESAAQTKQLAKKLARRLQTGDVLALSGQLGAGKTCFTQGICRGRGIGIAAQTPVTSPTFTLVNEYPAEVPVYHLDLYRIASDEEFYFSGLDEFFADHAITVVEWADKHADVIPDRAIWITISFLDRDKRSIQITCDEAYHEQKKIEL